MMIPDNDNDIIKRIRELNKIIDESKKEVKILQAAHNHKDIEYSGDMREHWSYCKTCGKSL